MAQLDQDDRERFDDDLEQAPIQELARQSYDEGEAGDAFMAALSALGSGSP